MRGFLTKLIALTVLSLPLWANAVTVSVQVSANNDDVEEGLADGNVSRGSSDLELAYDGTRRQITGMRFQNVSIPTNVTIVDAYIQFTVDETDSGATNLLVFGEDIDDAPAFSTTNGDVSNRTPTSNTVPWSNVPAWNSVGASGLDQRTPDLTAVIQEIIDRGGWSSGNDVVLMIAPGTGCSSSACQRTAESRNGSAGSAPELFIEYVTTVPNTADLSISKTDSVDPVSPGGIVNYTLTVNNIGPLDATNVIVTDTLPAGVNFVTATPTRGTCAFAAGTVSCNLGTVPAGVTHMVYLVVTMPNSTGTVTNTASVSADQPDANSANNSDSETTSTTPLNSEQLCYLVADQGGGNGGDDLLTIVDTANSSEVAVGTGTGTFNIEAIAWRSDTGTLYGADANRLGTIDVNSGVFTPMSQTFGAGGGTIGGSTSTVNLSDVDSLAWDATTSMLYGAHTRGGNELLFAINVATGAHIPDTFGPGIDFVEIQPILGNTIIDDIAVDPVNGVMYASINNGGTTDRLIIVNKATGATTDVAAITVPDIEGLGTDASGQLWGVSGTQNFIYEIDKNTGIGSNGRSLSAGNDYEAVDCFARSPATISDISVTKTVSDPVPLSGDSIDYTIDVSNESIGLGSATILQIEDVLPAGVTFVSAVATAGTYDASTGVWYIGTLAKGSSEQLTITVTVDAASAGSTVTNTASVLTLFQVDPNASNDSSSVDIDPPGPDINSTKSIVTVSDPYTATGNPKAIPGAVVEYTILVDNDGPGSVDADTLVLTDAIPVNTALFVTDFDLANSGPIAFTDGSPASGISYNFINFASSVDSIVFSNDGGTTYIYTPADSGDGTDPDVTHIQIQFDGAMLGDAGAGRQFEVRFRVMVQ